MSDRVPVDKDDLCISITFVVLRVPQTQRAEAGVGIYGIGRKQPSAAEAVGRGKRFQGRDRNSVIRRSGVEHGGNALERIVADRAFFGGFHNELGKVRAASERFSADDRYACGDRKADKIGITAERVCCDTGDAFRDDELCQRLAVNV